MAYNFPMNYQYYPQVQNNGLVWVQGESGAKSYMVPANGTALLMDSETDQFFIKSTDASGMPLPLRTFKYAEITPVNAPKNDFNSKVEEIYVTKEELANFKQEMLSMLNDEVKG